MSSFLNVRADVGMFPGSVYFCVQVFIPPLKSLLFKGSSSIFPTNEKIPQPYFISPSLCGCHRCLRVSGHSRNPSFESWFGPRLPPGVPKFPVWYVAVSSFHECSVIHSVSFPLTPLFSSEELFKASNLLYIRNRSPHNCCSLPVSLWCGCVLARVP